MTKIVGIAQCPGKIKHEDGYALSYCEYVYENGRKMKQMGNINTYARADGQ